MIDSKPHDRYAFGLQLLDRMRHGMVLDARRDDLPDSLGFDRAFDGEIVGFSAATGEKDFGGRCPDQLCDLLA